MHLRSWVALLALVPAVAMGADLARFFATVHTASGRFTEVVRGRHGAMVTHARGRVWLARPGRFRWDYDKPYTERIIGRGRGVWLYDPGLRQATRYSLNHALGRTPALLLAGRGHLTHLFRVQPLPSRAGLAWLELKPRGRGKGFRWIRIGYRGVHIEHIVLRDALGQTTTITINHWRINPTLPASLFVFRPPPHTAIVRE